MTRGLLKNRGRLITIAAALFFVAASPAGQLDTVLENSVISVGDMTMLRITFNQSEDIQPKRIPRVPGLELSYAGMGKSIQIINWKQSVSVVLSFSIRAERPGLYTIPPLEFQTSAGKMLSRQVPLKVVAGGASGSGEHTVSKIMGRVAFSKKSVYVGEPFVMNYYLFTAGVNASLEGFNKNPSSTGFVLQQLNTEQSEESYREGGVDYMKTKVSSYVLIPAGAGTFQVGGGSAVITTDASDNTFSFFGRPLPFAQQQSVGFGTESVHVVPLPQNAPATFQGDVGSFTITATYDPCEVNVFQEKRIQVTVKGTGNFISMSRPGLEKELSGAKVIAEDGESSYKVTGNGIEGEKKFSMTIIPTHAGTIDAGSVLFTFFNPQRGVYETAKSAPILFQAKGEGDSGRMEFDRERRQEFDFNPVLIGFILLAVGGFVALFILWERKRYRMVTENQNPVKEEAQETNGADRAEAMMKELEASYRSNDKSSFLLYADRTLKQAERIVAENKNNEAQRVALNAIKDTVYFYRYGGGSIDRIAMEKILKKIKEIIE